MRKYLAVDYEFCTGCHTCEIACQQEHGLAPDRFGIKLTQIGPDQLDERRWQYEFVPVPTDRCDRCARRQAAGKAPTCVQHCQAGCLYCGTLDTCFYYDKENNACCSFSGLVRYGSGDYERMGTTASLVQAMLFAMDVTAKCQKSEKGDRS